MFFHVQPVRVKTSPKKLGRSGPFFLRIQKEWAIIGIEDLKKDYYTSGGAVFERLHSRKNMED